MGEEVGKEGKGKNPILGLDGVYNQRNRRARGKQRQHIAENFALGQYRNRREQCVVGAHMQRQILQVLQGVVTEETPNNNLVHQGEHAVNRKHEKNPSLYALTFVA